MKPNPHACLCACCRHASSPPGFPAGTNRREFLFTLGAVAAGGALGTFSLGAKEPVPGLKARGPMAAKPLKIQPVLTYDLPQRREATSWRNWGGVQTEADALAEQNRIEKELSDLRKRADFDLQMQPVTAVRSVEQGRTLAAGEADVLLVFAAGGDGRILESLVSPAKWNLMFLRHDPGPVYLWYEIVHPRFLRKTVDNYGQPGMDVKDVVVDKYDELLWRLRALHGLKNTLGKRVLAIGGAGGWGEGGQAAPEIARKLWKMDLVDYSYRDLEPRLRAARQDPQLAQACQIAAGRYLKQSRVKLGTPRAFVDRAFVLNEVIKDLMEEAGTDAMTIQHCMGAIMGISETTACLPLSLLNDDGYLAFCESDFVVIPSGVLLHYISGKPVFLNDPTYPHGDVVTLAHCTAPRKMDGRKAEPVRVLTHFESDYGAAPKVEMRLGQVCTNLVPDFASAKWVGFEGTIVGNPFLDICRSQIDVRIKGDSAALLEHMKGFHWMLSYGDYLRETGYALGKIGVEFQNVSVGPARLA